MDAATSPSEPFIVRSSPKALLGRFALPVATVVLFAIGALYLRQIGSAAFANVLLAADGLFAIGIGIRAALVGLRIRNTEYAIYDTQLQESSYLLKFLGAKNNTVKLSEVNQIKCYSNGWLDVWFFNCGKIQMVTSGDQVDFIMENVHDPMKVKDQLEKRIFGEVASNEEGLRAGPSAAP